MGKRTSVTWTVIAAIILAVISFFAFRLLYAYAFSWDANGQGGGCSFSESIEQFQQNPPPCTGTIDVMVRVHWDGYPDGEDNVCSYIYGGTYDCSTGTITNDADEAEGIGVVQAPCNQQATQYNNCEINKWTGKLECDFWSWKLNTAANLPCAVLDIEPYPVTLVRWPTYFRFSGAGEAVDTDHIDFKGRGTKQHPMPGDEKDITLKLLISPYAPFMNLYLPHAGRFVQDGAPCAGGSSFVLPLQSPLSVPATKVCWNKSSHPAAGQVAFAGQFSGLDELPADMPVFVGWARVPYKATWSLTYKKWQVIRKWCELGPKEKNGQYIYECKTDPNLNYDNGHWEYQYGWKSHFEGGMIDPNAVSSLPSYMKADINNDGVYDAFWGYGVEIRRMDENFSVTNPVYRRIWACRSYIPIGVREAQSQSQFYPGSP